MSVSVTLGYNQSRACVQAMSTMLEALQRNLEDESDARKAEAAARVAAQERCSAADERVSKLEWESDQAAASLQRKVCPSAPHCCSSPA